MSSETVPISLRDVFADTLEVPAEEVTPLLDADSTQTWDSFRHLQLFLSLENEYGVQFDPGEIPELTSVAKVKSALELKGVTFE